MIRFLDDMVERVGGIINFILCVIIASTLTVAVMVFLASGYMIWLRW